MAKIHVSKASDTRNWIQVGDVLLICRAWEKYSGDVTVFESAVGVLLIGRLVGYDGIRVLHTWPTLRKYEQILNVSFKALLRRQTPDSDRLNGVRLAKKFNAFWKAIAAGVSTEPGAKLVGSDA